MALAAAAAAAAAATAAAAAVARRASRARGVSLRGRALCSDAAVGDDNRRRALDYLRAHQPAAAPLPPSPSPPSPPPPSPAPPATAPQRVQKSIPSVAGTLPSPLAVKALLEAEHGALDVAVVDVADKASFADCLIVCSGYATSHVRAIAHGLKNDMRARGVTLNGDLVSLCGTDSLDWIVVDIGPIVVHVMTAEARQHYQLEQLWLPDTPPQSTIIE